MSSTITMQIDTSNLDSTSIYNPSRDLPLEQPRSIFKTYWKQTETSTTQLTCPESPRGVAEPFASASPDPIQLSPESRDDYQDEGRGLRLVESPREVALTTGLGALRGWLRTSLSGSCDRNNMGSKPRTSCLRQPRYSKCAGAKISDVHASSSLPRLSVTFNPEAEVVYLESPSTLLFAPFSWFD